MLTAISIDIAASPQHVFDLAHVIADWPRLLPHYREVTIESRDGERVVAKMSAVRPGALQIPVSWRAEAWSSASDPDDLQMQFRHVGGATRGMDVVWHIRSSPSGARVTIEHEFSRPLPLLGADAFPRLVDLLFVRPIAGRTLATFKALAEREAA
jgi:aromatase